MLGIQQVNVDYEKVFIGLERDDSTIKVFAALEWGPEVRPPAPVAKARSSNTQLKVQWEQTGRSSELTGQPVSKSKPDSA